MANGDPRFGHTFVKLRCALIEEVVTAKATNWCCRICGGEWDGTTSKLKASTHTESCVLSLYRDDDEYP